MELIKYLDLEFRPSDIINLGIGFVDKTLIYRYLLLEYGYLVLRGLNNGFEVGRRF